MLQGYAWDRTPLISGRRGQLSASADSSGRSRSHSTGMHAPALGAMVRITVAGQAHVLAG